MGPDAMIFIFLMLSFKPAFSVSSFSFIKKVLMLSAIRMVSSAYLRLLISLPAILCQESVISLVLSYWNKDLKQETSATAQLQLRVLFGKQRIVPCGSMRVGWPQKRGLNPSWLPFLRFCLPRLPNPTTLLPLCKLGLARKRACLFRPRSSLRPWVFPSLPFCGLLPFSAFQRFTCASSSQAWHTVRLYDALHAYHGKRRRTEEPLDESERGEWKNQLKTLHSES